MQKQVKMGDWRAEDIRQQLIEPLIEVMADLLRGAKELETSAREGFVEQDWLPLKDAGAVGGITGLQEMVRDLEDKLHRSKLTGQEKYRPPKRSYQGPRKLQSRS